MGDEVCCVCELAEGHVLEGTVVKLHEGGGLDVRFVVEGRVAPVVERHAREDVFGEWH